MAFEDVIGCSLESACFPRHGRANNRAGEECLWLPILSPLLDNSWYTVAMKEVDGNLQMDHVVNEHLLHYTNYAKSGHESMLRLVEVLRLLSEALAKFEAHTDLSFDDPKFFSLSTELQRLIPIYGDYAFVLLRRLADQLITALAPLMYENPHGAPKAMKTFLRAFPSQANPKFSESTYIDLVAHTSWFSGLREADAGGIRDLLMHRPSDIKVGFTRSGDVNRVVAYVEPKAAEPNPGQSINLLERLSETLECFCTFLTRVCLAIELEGPYDGRRHWPHLSIASVDPKSLVRFWPK